MLWRNCASRDFFKFILHRLLLISSVCSNVNFPPVIVIEIARQRVSAAQQDCPASEPQKPIFVHSSLVALWRPTELSIGASPIAGTSVLRSPRIADRSFRDAFFRGYRYVQNRLYQEQNASAPVNGAQSHVATTGRPR